MKLTQKIFSAMTAAAVSVGAVPAVIAAPVSAAVTTDYSSSDTITDNSIFFYSGCTAAVREKLTKAFENATRKTLNEITYGDLEKVTTLNLSGMGLEGVPKAVQYMVKLRTLNLSNNRLCTIDLNSVDLTGCINLSSIDLSNNYITTVPAWYVSMDITTKKINGNLISDASGQRSLVASPTVYYFMDGDVINENKFKNKVLSSIKLSDGSALPDFFFDPEDLPYDEDDPTETNIISYNQPLLEIDKWDLSKNTKKNEDGELVVTAAKSASVDVSVCLYYGLNATANPNTNVTIKVYFLNGNDSSSFRVRLESLISSCGAYTKNDYTVSSWNTFEAALKTAQTIYNYESADIEMIREALENLELAKNALVKGISSTTKKTLTDLIAIAATYKESDYTAKSWSEFTAALAMLKAAADNPDASVNEANAAIKAYQDAQRGLVATSLDVPTGAPKTDFDAIYGEDKEVVYTGTTREGYKYKWVFNGKDITEPKAFNPEVLYESANEEAIRLEVGSASDYQLISFAEKGSFPGTGTLTLDVSGKYANGTYRLYKWNTTTKKGEYVENVTVKSGSVTLRLSSGGDYYISSVLQNFNMISNVLTIDNDKLTISPAFKSRTTVGAFKNALENGSAVIVRDTEGTAQRDSDYIATGMTATAPNSDVSYTIVVPGDINGDGYVTALDAVDILRAIVGEITLSDYFVKAAADVNGDGWVRADDAVEILKFSIGM